MVLHDLVHIAARKSRADGVPGALYRPSIFYRTFIIERGGETN